MRLRLIIIILLHQSHLSCFAQIGTARIVTLLLTSLEPFDLSDLLNGFLYVFSTSTLAYIAVTSLSLQCRRRSGPTTVFGFRDLILVGIVLIQLRITTRTH